MTDSSAGSSTENPGELWDAYGRTVIIGEGRAVWAVPQAVVLEGTWHVLTGSNPGGRLHPDDENRRFNAELESMLGAFPGTPHWVEGRSPDGSWSEPSVAIEGLDAAEACRLGRHFGQVAVFELTTDELRVLRCVDGEVMRRRRRSSAVTPPP
jgi:hypothetical protein